MTSTPSDIDTQSRPRLFLSYATADRDAAVRLADDLRKAGLEVRAGADLIADLSPGQDWASAVIDELEDADTVLVLLSPASERSERVVAEASLALAKALRDPTMRVVPVIVEKPAEVPSLLRGIQALDLSSLESHERQLARLVEEITTARGRDQTRAAVEDLANALAIRGAALESERSEYEAARAHATEVQARWLVRFFAAAIVLTVLATVIVAIAAWRTDNPERLGTLLTPLIALVGAFVGYVFGRESASHRDRAERR